MGRANIETVSDAAAVEMLRKMARAMLVASGPSEGPKATDAAVNWIRSVAEGGSDPMPSGVDTALAEPVFNWIAHWYDAIEGRRQYHLCRLGVPLACAIVSGNCLAEVMTQFHEGVVRLEYRK